MKKCTEIFRQGDHSWILVARDPARPDHLIDTNEYIVRSGGSSLLTDPGGLEIFPHVFPAVVEAVDPETLLGIFASHQDPDVISSLSLWLAYKPSLKCWLSWLWTSFVPHFGGSPDTFVPIPDEGMRIHVGQVALDAVPAHYLHSSGNFHLYDPVARILFTGDIGAALVPADAPLVVTDFDRHIQLAEGFHRRWMGSNEARRDWCDRVAALKVDQLCPQHGCVYRGADVERFINWFSDFRVGRLRDAA